MPLIAATRAYPLNPPNFKSRNRLSLYSLLVFATPCLGGRRVATLLTNLLCTHHFNPATQSAAPALPRPACPAPPSHSACAPGQAPAALGSCEAGRCPDHPAARAPPRPARAIVRRRPHLSCRTCPGTPASDRHRSA